MARDIVQFMPFRELMGKSGASTSVVGLQFLKAIGLVPYAFTCTCTCAVHFVTLVIVQAVWEWD